MEEEIETTIISLKNLLKKKYGEEFSKFYLVNHKNDDWSGLITKKNLNDENRGEYYTIDKENVIMEN